MSLLKFSNIELKAISACIPKQVLKNSKHAFLLTEKEIENAIRTTGIEERRIASEDICSSDLCYNAAKQIFDSTDISRDDIDLLIFVTQTPDYRQPGTAMILQDKLGLPKSCASFDINLACSGYIYGLSTAFSFAMQENINSVLLLVGETSSKTVSIKDRATGMLFGDAGSATIISKSDVNLKSWFSLNSDGSGFNILNIPAGGYRNPSTKDTLEEKLREDNSLRSDEQLFMDGMEVFTFTMREVPKDVKKVLKFAEKQISDIDYAIFHQANKFIANHFIKKLKIEPEKALFSIEKYGNTSSASIPLTIVSQLDSNDCKNRKMLLSGFGSGLSWGSAFIEVDKPIILPVLEI